MKAHVMFLLLALLLLWIPSVNAQPAVNIGSKDYFQTAQLGMVGDGYYLRVLESAHVNNVPDQIGRGRLNDALHNIRYTLDRFPNHPRALQQLSIVSQMIKNTALGVEYFEKAIKLFPQYAITRAQFGLYLTSIGNVAAGIDMLKRSTEMDPKLPAGYAGLAHAYVKMGDMTKAREAAEKARELGFRGKLPDGL